MNILKKLNHFEFVGLLNQIKYIQMNKSFKDFFILSIIYTEIKKKSGILDNLSIEEDNEV